MASELSIPDGFRLMREEGVSLILREGRAEALAATGLADPEAAAAAAGEAARSFEGRGKPVSFPVPGAAGPGEAPLRVVVRRYLHGGLLRGITGGLFPGAGRFLRELRTAEHVFRAGVPVPEPLGLVVRDAGAGAARGWFLSREEEGVEDLRSLLLRTAPGDPVRKAALVVAGRVVRLLHDAGVLHADLHFKNVLVPPDGSRALVVDLDDARLLEKGLTRDQRATQIQRFDRSLVKLRVRTGKQVTLVERRRFVLAYLGEDRPTEEESARWRRKHRAHLSRHRLGWKLGAG